LRAGTGRRTVWMRDVDLAGVIRSRLEIRTLTWGICMFRPEPRVNRPTPLALGVAVLLVLTGCASATPIGDLINNPARYDGKTVRVEGEVIEAAGGLGMGAYAVRDNTGTLPIVSDRGGAPQTGAKVDVKGRFQALLTIGSRGLAVLREESRTVRQ
jgi:hypothetical protein